MLIKTTSGRATQRGVTLDNAILISEFGKKGRHPAKADQLFWNNGSYFHVNGAGRVHCITRREAVERFIRFHTAEYFEGTTKRADLLLGGVR